MPEVIQVTPLVQVPESAISIKAVRSGGPGGQNVNKVASKIELRIDLTAIQGLSEDALERLRHLLRNRLDADGHWMITSSLTRDQQKNLEDARQKAIQAILEAIKIPEIRIATRPGRGAKRRRMDDKRRLSDKKRNRSGGFD